MVKDSDGRPASVGILFVFQPSPPIPLRAPTEGWSGEGRTAEREKHEEHTQESAPKKKDVIAYRKTCKAKGTGLSHYILMDKKAK